MTPQDTMRLALEALEYHTEQTRPIHKTNAAIEALRSALAQQGEQRYISIERVSGFPDKLDDGPQPILYSDSINGCMVRRDDVWLALTSQLKDQVMAQQGEQPEYPASPMTAKRAAYFMERFKKEEKLLGPNEQAAVDFVLEMLAQQEPDTWTDDGGWTFPVERQIIQTR